MKLESLRNWQRIQVWEAVGPTEGSAMQNGNYKLLREYTVALKSQSIFDLRSTYVISLAQIPSVKHIQNQLVSIFIFPKVIHAISLYLRLQVHMTSIHLTDTSYTIYTIFE